MSIYFLLFFCFLNTNSHDLLLFRHFVLSSWNLVCYIHPVDTSRRAEDRHLHNVSPMTLRVSCSFAPDHPTKCAGLSWGEEADSWGWGTGWRRGIINERDHVSLGPAQTLKPTSQLSDFLNCIGEKGVQEAGCIHSHTLQFCCGK